MTAASSPRDKINLFRSLFHGRADVLPRRWQNAKTGKKGFSPACRNEWVPGVCQKPKVKCSDCVRKAFVPVDDDVIAQHLRGTPGSGSDPGDEFVIGVYPILPVSFELVARRSKANYVLGLSATVVRKDGYHPIIFMLCGPKRHRVDAKSQAARSSFDHRDVIKETSFRSSVSVETERPPIAQIYRELANNERRNALIFDDVLSALKEGRCPIVLTERRQHLDHLADRFRSFVRNLIVLRGGMKVGERKVAQSLINNDDIDERLVLATGRHIGEGFDAPVWIRSFWSRRSLGAARFPSMSDGYIESTMAKAT